MNKLCQSESSTKRAQCQAEPSGHRGSWRGHTSKGKLHQFQAQESLWTAQCCF
jgi:hypothetical protein